MVVNTLQDVLKQLVREGELYEKLPDNRVKCYSCGHECTIFDGLPGVCKVRFNEGGKLYVPWGYVAALQLDPIEKKPFFHAYPGTKALSFGMLGCGYHCSYCVGASTWIPSAQGVLPIEELFASAPACVKQPDGVNIAYPDSLEVYTHKGCLRRVRALFCHPYEGKLMKITPMFCPPMECTPEHEFLAIPKPAKGEAPSRPTFMPAVKLTTNHCLAVPKRYTFSHEITLDVTACLQPFAASYSAGRRLPEEMIHEVMSLTQQGWTSRQVGERISKDPSHVRHIRSHVNRGIWDLGNLYRYQTRVVVEGDCARFTNERAPGIPKELKVNTILAALLGYYCAEGCVVRDRNRVNSASLHFSFGKHESHLAQKVKNLLQELFGVQPHSVHRETTHAVSIGKASLALLFESLCGVKARSKRVPHFFFEAPREVIEAFINAYVEGDGSVDADGRVTVSTASEELTYGVAWLVVKLGFMPSVREYAEPERATVLRRRVNRAPKTFYVMWRRDNRHRSLWQDEEYYYIPIRRITERQYSGEVYNMEVEGDHTYLASFLATHNCQNWLSSQALRDPLAGHAPELITPEQFVHYALRTGAKVVTSTYNEPLITSEWAVAIFKEAKRHGLITSYVSNGNATRQVLEYLHPWLDLYKVDLKSFNDKNYRKLGGRLQTVLDTIANLWEMGLWVEVVTLVVPDFNDSDDELRKIAEFLLSVSPDIPWHVTAFHPDYKMTDRGYTPAKTLLRAARIGEEAGLRYIYAGNLPGMTGKYENTYCHNCKALLIERYGFRVSQYRLKNGACYQCGTTVPGRWEGNMVDERRGTKQN